DKWGMIKGYKLCLSYMWPTIVNYDFKFDCNKFEMPYYIFQGRLDKNTPSDLIEDFYNVIDAPKKELVWFENSAHGPLSEEPEKFKALIREKFLD
ncbi:MAG: alpha/beta hydrolase, partial [Clostridia bacterium]